jgi:hypothetical protein
VWPRGDAGGMRPLDATVLEVRQVTCYFVTLMNAAGA